MIFEPGLGWEKASRQLWRLWAGEETQSSYPCPWQTLLMDHATLPGEQKMSLESFPAQGSEVMFEVSVQFGTDDGGKGVSVSKDPEL